MMILKRLGLALLLIMGAALIGALFIAAPVRAEGLDKGSTVLSIQLTRGDGDFLAPPDIDGYVTAYDHTEWGGQLQVQHLLSTNWALAASVGIGTTSETNTPGNSSLPGALDFEYSQSSFNVRLGLDRFAHISSDFHLYAGPGLQYWSGNSTFDDGVDEFDTPDVTRIALSGRLGAVVALSESINLNGHLGGYIGIANGEENGSEADWTPTGNEGAVGIAFAF